MISARCVSWLGVGGDGCELTAVDGPEAVVAAGERDDVVEMAAVGVGDEYLAEGVGVGDEAHDALHAVAVEFVEDVVEQQQRSHAGGSAQEVVLGHA